MLGESLFEDRFLDELFHREGVKATCNITDQSELCLSIDRLKELFDPLVKIYEPYHPHEAPAFFAGGSSEDEGPMVWETIESDFGVFHSENEPETNRQIIFSIYSVDIRKGDYNPYLEQYVYRFDHGFEYDCIADEESFRRKEWENFKNELLHKNRFFPQSSSHLSDLKKVIQYSASIVKANTKVYRARPSNLELPLEKMGPPPKGQATPGRANPKGIPYLYLGFSQNVCALEIKIEKGEGYTIAEYEIAKELSIVDLAYPRVLSPFLLGSHIKDYIRSLGLLDYFGKEISSKTVAKDPYLEYLPTQYICELIKNEGYDGIRYTSSLSSERKDVNLVLFSETKVKKNSTSFHKRL